MKFYVKECDICLASKTVRHKSYGDFQSLFIPTHQWKNLSKDFITRLSISTNWKSDNYDSILVIVNWLTTMVHYKLVKVSINTPKLVKVIIDMVVRHHNSLDFFISEYRAIFTSKFWFSLCYFLDINRQLSTTFYPQTNRQTKQQNSTIEAYLWAFVNLEQNDWARLLPMVEFAYNNAKNASTGHTLFEFNCVYHLRISYRKDVNCCFKSKSTDTLSVELWELIIVCPKNLYHTEKLQKQAHDKGVKAWSYAYNIKFWLNNKYIKTKRNHKLETKFFGPFRVFYPVGK